MCVQRDRDKRCSSCNRPFDAVLRTMSLLYTVVPERRMLRPYPLVVSAQGVHFVPLVCMVIEDF